MTDKTAENKILIVSSDPYITGIYDVVSKRSKPDYITYTAGDGSEAAEMAEKIVPDLIFILGTSSVPGIDGLTLCEILHTNPKLQNAKIILSSAHHPLHIVGVSLLAGASECLPKPFIPKEIITTTSDLLKGE